MVGNTHGIKKNKKKTIENDSQNEKENIPFKTTKCWVWSANHALCIVLKKWGLIFVLTVHCISYYKFVYMNIDFFSLSVEHDDVQIWCKVEH